MENYKGGLKSYWKKYERLHGESGHRRPRSTRVELGKRKRKFWRIKLSPRLRFLSRIRKLSPMRILSRIRDAYVRMMLRIAQSSAVAGGGYGYVGHEVSRFGNPIQKEYDEKMIVEIYRSIIAQSQLVAAAAAAETDGSQAPAPAPTRLGPSPDGW